MNILFLTICKIDDISERGIYADLMRKFRNEGHEVFIVSPAERRFNQPTSLSLQNGVHLLKVRTLNLQKTSLFEKGIGILLLKYQFLSAIKKYFPRIYFDVVLYSTPPITFTKVVKYVKRQRHAKSYLLLKDIFPQNAVDLGMIKSKGLLHKYFREKEKSLYKVSDFIGCMSQANVEYLCKHNSFIKPEIIEVNPNSIEPMSTILSIEKKEEIRKQYGIPRDSTAFIYGGNLGKPQGIEFLIEVLKANIDTKYCFFVIVGSGTEYAKIEKWFKLNQPSQAILFSSLDKQEYDRLVQSCDVGMIFLDKHFTIPNYPSRLLSYLEFKMPVIAATDSNTDIGKDAEENGYGFWCESGNLELINNKIELLSNNQELIRRMGIAGYNYLVANFTVDNSFSIIMKHLNKNV